MCSDDVPHVATQRQDRAAQAGGGECVCGCRDTPPRCPRVTASLGTPQEAARQGDLERVRRLVAVADAL
eukprot:4337250-Prymnesium_polylepis.1